MSDYKVEVIGCVITWALLIAAVVILVIHTGHWAWVFLFLLSPTPDKEAGKN